ncbi:N-6 DNA methylase [Pseudoalteromonas sp. PAR1]|uniref:N-6 DNA methylase n=1 Tax=Pseudoalteromonas sp. PAR1 TaxID=2853443 RepID=UPI00248AA22E|nr:N-6 DNA methylase [Pseudoalteromonas sp. PAR1]
MMTNELAVKFVEAYKDSDLLPANLDERLSFLALLTIELLAITEHGKYQKSLTNLQVSDDIKSIDVEKFDFTESEQLVVKQAIAHLNDEKINKLLSRFNEIHEAFDLSKLTRTDSITLYEQTLKLLQEPKVFELIQSDAKGFDFQLRPDDFSRLIASIVKSNEKLAVYDAMASTGELSNYLAQLNPQWHFTTESLLQNPHYLVHKFVLAGNDDCVVSQSYSLNSTPFIKASTFDLAFALYEPTAVRKSASPKVKKSKEGGSLSGHYDPKRIDLDIISSQYNDHALLQHLIWSINETGIAIAFVGRGALQRIEEAKSRKFLIENNYVDAVIQLPTSLISARTVDLFAVILRKNKQTDDIMFIDASSYFNRDIKRNKLVREDEIANILTSRKNIPDICQVITNGQVEKLSLIDETTNESNFSLNVAAYISRSKKIIDPTSIDELIDELTLIQSNTNQLFDKLMKKI